MSTGETTTEANEIEIECDIPYDLPNYTCIQYPGKINNVNAAIETLGGDAKIQQTFTKFNEFQTHNKAKKKKGKKSMTSANKNNIHKEPYLELHLNPNGVMDHALFGKIRPVKNCILIKKTTKIKKKNPLLRKRKFNEMNETNNHQSQIEVMGRITSLVTYDELCDFQVFSDLKYPQKIVSEPQITNNNNNNNSNMIHQTNKRRRIWSLSEDDIPNISKYPLIPQVFASKAVPYDDILKQSNQKSNKTSPTKQQMLETKPTEILFKRKQVPKQPKKGSQWLKWLNDLNEYISDSNNRDIPKNNNKNIKTNSKLSENEKISFCMKIRNELVLQIKSYFEQRPIWSKPQILLQKFYICWYYIRYFADKIEVTQTNSNNDNNNNKNDKNDTFYDFDIASIVFDRKQKRNFYLSALHSRNIEKTRKHQKDHRLLQLSPKLKAMNAELNNNEKIYLDFKEKEKIISKFLGIIGYKFKNGPFRNSYIKFGFDPRFSSNKTISRPLQMIDYRINKKNGKKLGIESSWTGGRGTMRGKPTQTNTLTHTREHIASMMNNQQINMETQSVRNERFLAEEMNMNMNINNHSLDMSENESLEREIMDRLMFRMAPDKLQVYYQLCNIEMKGIKDIINNKNENSYNNECLKDCGWIVKKDEAKIRELMNERLEQWIVKEKERKKQDKLIEKLTLKRKEISNEILNENEEENMMQLDNDMMPNQNGLIHPLYHQNEQFNEQFNGQFDDSGDKFELL